MGSKLTVVWSNSCSATRPTTVVSGLCFSIWSTSMESCRRSVLPRRGARKIRVDYVLSLITRSAFFRHQLTDSQSISSQLCSLTSLCCQFIHLYNSLSVVAAVDSIIGCRCASFARFCVVWSMKGNQTMKLMLPSMT